MTDTLVLLKIDEKIEIEHKGARFIFRQPNGFDQIGFWSAVGQREQFKEIFALLEKIEGVDIKVSDVYMLDGSELAAIASKYFKRISEIREAQEKNAPHASA